MLSVFKKLIEGDGEVVDQFSRARNFWQDFVDDSKDLTVDELASKLDRSQFKYELLFNNNRAFAKETMALTCIATLYDEINGWDTNEDIAVKIATAFLKSSVSSEVKSYARDVIRIYSLHERNEDLERLVNRNR